MFIALFPARTAENSCDTFGASAPLFIGKLVGLRILGESFMLRKSLVVLVVFLMATSFVGIPGTSAHNIDLKKAREIVRDYARQVRDESGGKYVHYSTNCVNAFPNHNHIARCLVEFRNAADDQKGVYTCRELIEIKLPHHDGSTVSFNLRAVHASYNQCGSRRFNDDRVN
ncbi:MAG TPA: hypothetical protein VLE19_18325 [Pyrinomonadaceae bacterium]|nr:hypothetical protein [Pyrinomonadaceae bacterium]